MQVLITCRGLHIKLLENDGETKFIDSENAAILFHHYNLTMPEGWTEPSRELIQKLALKHYKSPVEV